MKAQFVAFQECMHFIPGTNALKKITRKMAIPIALFTLFFLAGASAYGQEYRYQFQLKSVTDLAEAKMVTDVLRPVFNTEAAPFKVFPTFNDAVDQFDFVSEIAVSKEELEAVLAANGIELLSFSSITGVKSQTEK
ncbi:MAG TPA: hypothetical protein VK151_18710 [Fluviicola sp.]|nr:hypothetical protein [Fluviicola sp.]